jgi:MFS transporter, ACS family, solute carrier family 17 (sodium-dependent inorganic phosphate cotransporter), other
VTWTRSWPRRHVLVALAFLGCTVAFTDRVNLSVAAVAMKEQFGWSQTEKGFILSAFFAGYMSCMFLAGILASRFGGRRVAGIAVFIWSLFTLLTPLAASFGIPALVAARLGLGVGEAPLFPAIYQLFGRWIPLRERARAASFFTSGVPVGSAIGLTASGWLVARYGWPMPFYVFGGIGLLWMMLWLRHVTDDPREQSRISSSEMQLLTSTASPSVQTTRTWPVRRLLLRWPVLAVVTGQFATFWSQNVLAAWLPSYFRDVQGVSIEQSGLFSAGPWVAMILALNGAGALSDHLIHRGLSVTHVRKLMQCGGLIASAFFLLATRFAHSPVAALAILIAATSALGVASCGFVAGNLDIAPRHSALMVGFSNTLGQTPGLIGVAVTGWLIDITGTYNTAFVLAATISIAGAGLFALLFEARPLTD